MSTAAAARAARASRATKRIEMLEGADEIAASLGLPTHRIYRLAESRSLPVFKLRGKLYARPDALIAAIKRLESETPDAA